MLHFSSSFFTQATYTNFIREKIWGWGGGVDDECNENEKLESPQGILYSRILMMTMMVVQSSHPYYNFLSLSFKFFQVVHLYSCALFSWIGGVHVWRFLALSLLAILMLHISCPPVFYTVSLTHSFCWMNQLW